MVNVDRVFGEIGELGRGQAVFCGIILAMVASSARHSLQYTFVGYSMPFECRGEGQQEEEEPYRDQCPDGESSGKMSM